MEGVRDVRHACMWKDDVHKRAEVEVVGASSMDLIYLYICVSVCIYVCFLLLWAWQCQTNKREAQVPSSWEFWV